MQLMESSDFQNVENFIATSMQAFPLAWEWNTPQWTRDQLNRTLNEDETASAFR